MGCSLSIRGASQVLTQISQREEERLLEQERKDQEALHMLKYLEKLQVEDLKVNWTISEFLYIFFFIFC